MKSLAWGNQTYEVSQPFGKYSADTAWMYPYAAELGWPAGTHVGIDVAVPKYTPIFAVQDGVVEQAGNSPFFRPRPVHIRQADGDLAIYGHLWENTVVTGQKIKAGQKIGLSGEQTKQGTMEPDGSGPHIHFELRRTDNAGRVTAVDPTPLLTGAEGTPDDNPYTLGYDGKQLISKDIAEAASTGLEYGTKIGAIMLGVVVVIAGIMVMSGAGGKALSIAGSGGKLAGGGVRSVASKGMSQAGKFNQARA